MGRNSFGKLVFLGSVIGTATWVYRKYDAVRTMYNKVYMFKGEQLVYDHFDGNAMAAMFSGIEINLKDAAFEEDEVYLDIYALCSGIKLIVPSHVEVICDGTVKASGVQINQDEFVEKTVQLYLNYDLTASGLMVTDAQPAPNQDDLSEVEDFIDEVIEETLEETIEDIQPST
jgi:hypothetical protein